MVERHGMGSFKLDSACYLFGAWHALAEMARVLERPEAHEYERLAADWLVRFERDWWLEDAGLYADSLHADYRPQLDGHWTQVVPVQMGIARPERARRVLDNIEREFTNRWGLMHTRGREDRVWTLPTGLLVLAELRYGRVARALDFLNNIALTAEYGMLGAFKELIPEGLCFVQLWSAGLYIQGLIEGLLGLSPRAHEHQLSIMPTLPPTWPAVSLSGLRIGQHLLNIQIGQTHCVVEQAQGPQALRIHFTPRGTSVAAIYSTGYTECNATIEQRNGEDSVTFDVGVGQHVTVQIVDSTAAVTYRTGDAEGFPPTQAS
jgi:hypothetical protein